MTYILIHLNEVTANDLRPKGQQKKRDSNGSEEATSDSDQSALRRQSQISARFRAKRAESIKNEHVMFADEIKDDDEKFTPNPDIADYEVRVFC